VFRLDTGLVRGDIGVTKRLLSRRGMRLASRQDGQTAAEYLVVIGMITVATVSAFAALNGSVRAAITAAVSAISTFGLWGKPTDMNDGSGT
jgi:Flp pilus assembly pilin Flp